MSAIKRYLEDVAQMVHTGDRAEIEDLLGTWPDEDKVNILLEAIELSNLTAPSCECLGHKLKDYRESNDNDNN